MTITGSKRKNLEEDGEHRYSEKEKKNPWEAKGKEAQVGGGREGGRVGERVRGDNVGVWEQN